MTIHFHPAKKDPETLTPSPPAPENDLLPAAVHPALAEYPSRLFVETTTRCNLRCRMCMKQTAGSGIIDGDMRPETFAALVPVFPHLDALILNGIGEPLLHPRLESFIRQARPLMPANAWVGFQSNGLLLNEGRALSLIEAGLNRICLSLDAVSPDRFRMIRDGGHVTDLERALNSLHFAKNRHGVPLAIGIEFVLMRENARELSQALRWAAARGATFAIVSHLLPYEKEHMASVAYETNTDEAIAFFKIWRERAQREGIDMWRYFKIMMNFQRSPDDQKVMDFVWAMHCEARSRGLFINLKNLLQRDESWFEELSAIFAKAKQVAEETGLDLHLPVITPRNKRSCDFVEQGSAFVDWNGSVHNCYFLWHQYSCYSSDSRKYVTPRSFGSLDERSLQEIWNDPAFVAYREEALAAEYPVCSNCTVSPCEYVYNEHFQQDCYAGTVACGDCFWSMGLFRCLQ